MYLTGRKSWKPFPPFFPNRNVIHFAFFFFPFHPVLELRLELRNIPYNISLTHWLVWTFGYSAASSRLLTCNEAGTGSRGNDVILERNILSPSRDWRYSRGTGLKLGHRDMSITYSISSLEPRCGGFDVKLKILLVTGTSINFDARPSYRSRNF